MRLRSPATLRALMEQECLTTRRLAERVKVHHSTIDHLLAGRREKTGDELAATIAKALRAPVELLWEPK